jgi:hypothetical protein
MASAAIAEITRPLARPQTLRAYDNEGPLAQRSWLATRDPAFFTFPRRPLERQCLDCLV